MTCEGFIVYCACCGHYFTVPAQVVYGDALCGRCAVQSCLAHGYPHRRGVAAEQPGR